MEPDGNTLSSHICVYLPEGECHIDIVPLAPDNTLEDFAEHAAQSVFDQILSFYEELPYANLGSTSVQ